MGLRSGAGLLLREARGGNFRRETGRRHGLRSPLGPSLGPPPRRLVHLLARPKVRTRSRLQSKPRAWLSAISLAAALAFRYRRPSRGSALIQVRSAHAALARLVTGPSAA